LAEVAPELRGVLADDLEVHDWLSHGHSFRAGGPAPGGAGPAMMTGAPGGAHRWAAVLDKAPGARRARRRPGGVRAGGPGRMLQLRTGSRLNSFRAQR